MADVKISALTAATSTGPTDVYPIVQGGVTLKAAMGLGTATNDNASAGQIGEYISSTVAAPGSALTTTTTLNVTSISLTAGDWDVSGTVGFRFGATTSYTNLVGGSSLTTATIGAQGSFFDYETAANVPTATSDATFVIPTFRVSIAITTTIFLIAQATFTVSTISAFGLISARRVR